MLYTEEMVETGTHRDSSKTLAANILEQLYTAAIPRIKFVFSQEEGQSKLALPHFALNFNIVQKFSYDKSLLRSCLMRAFMCTGLVMLRAKYD